MQNRRCKQIGTLLKTEIGRIIQTRLNDPLVGFVTLMDIEVSKDLKHAKVFVSVLGDEQQEQNAIKGLERARAFIQNELKQAVHLRYIPVLGFYLDTTWKKSARVDELIHQIHAQNISGPLEKDKE